MAKYPLPVIVPDIQAIANKSSNHHPFPVNYTINWIHYINRLLLGCKMMRNDTILFYTLYPLP